MSFPIKQQLIASSKYSIKCPYSMVAEYITVHNTYNDASAKNEITYMASNNNQVSYHIAVDDVEAIQAIPFNRNAWHAGDGGSGTGNRKSIGIEICYSKSGGSKYEKAEKNAIKLIAGLLKERGWTTAKVKKHQDWSGKNCPHRILAKANGWNSFIAAIQVELNAIKAQEEATKKAKEAEVLAKKKAEEEAAKKKAEAEALAKKKAEEEIKQKGVALLNATGKEAAINMIKKGVSEKLFTSPHANVENYSDIELVSYAMAYMDRWTDKMNGKVK